MKSQKEFLIEQKLKKEDHVELPMDNEFFDQMHDKIMQAIEKTEIKSQTKWTKTWVFLETKNRRFLPAQLIVMKTVFAVFVASLSLGLAQLSLGLFQQTHELQVSHNQQKIINTVAAAPADWAELAAVSQRDSDLYAEILNEKIDGKSIEGMNTFKDL